MTERKAKVRPYRTMDVGDEFFVPSDEALPNSVRTYTSQRAKDLGKRYSVRAVEGGTMVKRVE